MNGGGSDSGSDTSSVQGKTSFNNASKTAAQQSYYYY